MDWIACVLELFGAWTVGNKKKAGFIILIAGNVFWFGTGISKELYGLTAVAVIFILINIRNYRKWKK